MTHRRGRQWAHRVSEWETGQATGARACPDSCWPGQKQDLEKRRAGRFGSAASGIFPWLVTHVDAGGRVSLASLERQATGMRACPDSCRPRRAGKRVCRKGWRALSCSMTRPSGRQWAHFVRGSEKEEHLTAAGSAMIRIAPRREEAAGAIRFRAIGGMFPRLVTHGTLVGASR